MQLTFFLIDLPIGKNGNGPIKPKEMIIRTAPINAIAFGEYRSHIIPKTGAATP